MIVSYRKRSSPELEAGTQSFESRKDRAARPKSNMFGAFWQNLFRSHNPDVKKVETPSNNNIEVLTDPGAISSSSSESVNTILSTHSFSYVSARKYRGKRGKRIPITGHQNENLVTKPPSGVTNVNGRAVGSSRAGPSTAGIRPQRKFGTLTRLGMKIGLKSKYNLQSCESLPRFGMESTGNTMTNRNVAATTLTLKKRRAPAPPLPATPVPVEEPELQTRSIDSSPATTSASAGNKVQRHRRAFSETTAMENKARLHVRGKRRAPVPPNPFGDPDAPQEEPNPLDRPRTSASFLQVLRANSMEAHAECPASTSECKQLPGPSASNPTKVKTEKPSKQAQSPQDELRILEATMNSLQAHEKRINDEVKAQLLLLKETAQASPQAEIEENPTGTFLYAKVETSNNSQAPSSTPWEDVPKKIVPKPWYKRSPSKSMSKKTPPKPLTLLAKISELDREAVRIIAENRRRSAENAYNESAKELITMFTNNFTPSQNSSSNPNPETVPEPAAAAATPSIPDTSEIAQASASGNASSSNSNDDHKKLAIVQPQQSKPKGLTGLGALAGRSSAVTPYTRNPSQYFFRGPSSNNESEQWACPRCTLSNPHWRAICEVCYFRKDSAASYSPEVSDPEEGLINASWVVKPQSGFKPIPNPKPIQQVKPEEPPALPPGENFLSQLPVKNNLALEQKLVGMKLFDDPEVEELDIKKLREARLAFFAKTRREEENNFKPNNLNPSLEVETNSNPTDSNPNLEDSNVYEDDYDTIDAVAKLHQQLNPNTSGSGPGTWKPLQVHRFQPMLDSIRESTHSENYYEPLPKPRTGPVYENWKFKLSDLEEETLPWTRSFMQNAQLEIKDQIRFFDSLNPQYDSEDFLSDSDLNMERQDSTVEEYRRLGAIPKHLRKNGPEGHGRSERNRDERSKNEIRNGNGRHDAQEMNETFAISKVLRKLEQAISRGDHKLAASLAHDLALRKVNCVVEKNDKPITIRVYVEDRLMQQGPFLVQVKPSMTVKGLKAKIECDWGIPTTFQKWILGRKMAEEDDQPLSYFEVIHDSMGFLYLVTPDVDLCPSNTSNSNHVEQPKQSHSLNEDSTSDLQQKKHPRASQKKKEKMLENSQSQKSTHASPAKTSKGSVSSTAANNISKSKHAPIPVAQGQDYEVLQSNETPPKLPPKKHVQAVLKEFKADIHFPPSFSPEPVTLNELPMAKARQAKKLVQKVTRGTGTVCDVPIRIAQTQIPATISNTPKLPENANIQPVPKATPVPLPRSTISIAAHVATDPTAVPRLISYNTRLQSSSPIPFPRTNVPVDDSKFVKQTPEPKLSKSPTPKYEVRPETVNIKPEVASPVPQSARDCKSPIEVPVPSNENVNNKDKVIIRTASINVIEQVPKIQPKIPDSNLNIENPEVSKAVQIVPLPKTPPQPQPTSTAAILCEPRRKSFGDYVNTPLMTKGIFRHELNPGKLSKTIQKYEALQNPAGQQRAEIKKDFPGLAKFRPQTSNINSPYESKSRTTEIRSFLTRKNSDGLDINLEVTEGLDGPGTSQGTSQMAVPEHKEGNVQTYMNMIHLMEKEDLVPTQEDVECPVCLSKQPGVTLRDCLHSFCRECLIGAIQYSEEPQVKCPFRDDSYSCDSFIQEREIKALVPKEMFEKLLAKSMKMAESRMKNAYHCKTNDCTGWCIFEDDVNIFNCPVCSKRNCLTCQAIHTGKDCLEYQRELAIAAETDEDAKSSRLMLEKMIKRGEALECPACHVVLLKKWGCDYVKCTYCKTEICWITKGFRWGPNGKGDTSGGCKCGVNGVRCHPKCTYCH